MLHRMQTLSCPPLDGICLLGQGCQVCPGCVKGRVHGASQLQHVQLLTPQSGFQVLGMEMSVWAVPWSPGAVTAALCRQACSPRAASIKT